MPRFQHLKHSLCLAGMAGMLSSAALAAPSYELTMSAPIAGVTTNFNFNQTAWLRPGDLATFTVRYGANNTPDATVGAQVIYKNAINYFSVEITRGGTQTYLGEANGNFGQISLFDNVSNAYDLIVVRFLDSTLSAPYAYPVGTQVGTTPAPALSPVVTPAGQFGNMVLNNFVLRFTTVDTTAFATTALPTALSSSDFGPQGSTGPFGGFWDLTGDAFGPMSFGGANPATVAFRIIDDAPVETIGNGQTNNVPTPATLWLLAIGLGAAGLSRPKNRLA